MPCLCGRQRTADQDLERRVKLLFDQNLSPGLVKRLGTLFPGSAHVRSIGLREGSDEEIWTDALSSGMTIVTKDGDFHQMSRKLGAPPKVVWLRLGNCSTDDIERVLCEHAPDLIEFESDPLPSILIIE